MSHTNEKVYIEAVDDNGKRQNLTYTGWARITGHAATTISKRNSVCKKQKTEGMRALHEQAGGRSGFNYKRRERKYWNVFSQAKFNQ